MKPSVPRCAGVKRLVLRVGCKWPASRQYPSTPGHSNSQSRATPVSSPWLAGRQSPKFLAVPSASRAPFVSVPRGPAGSSPALLQPVPSRSK